MSMPKKPDFNHEKIESAVKSIFEALGIDG